MIKQRASIRNFFQRIQARTSHRQPAYFEALEARQLLSADIIGNTPAAAYNVGALTSTPFTQAESVNAADTKDFYKFTLSTSKVLTASLTGLSANADLRLYDQNGNVVQTSANFGSADESIQTSLAAGTYYVLVYRTTGETDYSLALSADNAVADTAGNSRAQAADLGTVTPGGSKTRSDYVGATDSNDYYKFTLSGTASISLSLTGLSDDADLQLVDADGHVMATSSHTGSTNETIATTLTAGSYFVRVYRYSGNTNYTMTLNTSAVNDNYGNDSTSAADLGLLSSTATTFSNSLNATNTDDYYAFMITSRSLITLNLSGLSANATLRLLDQTGKVVASSSNAGNASENISFRADRGLYNIRVSLALGSTSYTLSAKAVPVIATTITNTANGTSSVQAAGSSNSYHELDITGTSGDDIIEVTSTSTQLNVTINGNLNVYTITGGGVTLDEFAIWGGDGNDTIIVRKSVWLNCRVYGGAGNDFLSDQTSGRATIIAIGGGIDTIFGNASNTNYWFDSGDVTGARSTDASAGHVHEVAAFYQPYETSPTGTKYVPLELNGQNLEDPTIVTTSVDDVVTYQTLSNTTLWGAGPVIEDTNQGQVGDCYFLASIGSLAFANPTKLMDLAVDLGDGTYAVQFIRAGKQYFVRVDGQLPVSDYGTLYYNNRSNSGTYNSPIYDGPIWACIFEKAYAEFRASQPKSYQAIDGGWPNIAQQDLGLKTNILSSADDPEIVYQQIVKALANHNTVNICTVIQDAIPDSVDIVGSHVYVIIAANKDGLGNITYTVRNPWGVDHNYPSVASDYDGIVTFTAADLKSYCDKLAWGA